MKDVRLSDLLSSWTIVGSLVVMGCLVLATVVAAGWTARRQQADVGLVAADLTIIPPSTSTPLPTATPDNFVTATPIGQIGIDAYVQITGTEGAGLRIRREPGQGGDTVFLGEEEEIFVVKDGPQLADGYTWWYLVAPYDETRAGWAAADYLAAVASP